MTFWVLLIVMAFAAGVMLGEKVARRAFRAAVEHGVPRAVEETVKHILAKARERRRK